MCQGKVRQYTRDDWLEFWGVKGCCLARTNASTWFWSIEAQPLPLQLSQAELPAPQWALLALLLAGARLLAC